MLKKNKGQFRADLHCHSTCSDGTYTPKELLKLAKYLHLGGLSITDHDTIAAYTESIFKQAKNLGIRLLKGIEISSQWKNTSIHVLGYNFDSASLELNEFLQEMQKKRYIRNTAILEKLTQMGMPIEKQELILCARKTNSKTIGRPHIARIMVEKGYVLTQIEAFQKYLKDGACCYVSADKYSTFEIIQMLHRAKGKAILAHPHQITNQKIISSLLDLPFDGLEGYYAKLYPSQEKKWIQIGLKKKWIITGGSDFHGKDREDIALGCSWVDEDTFNKLL